MRIRSLATIALASLAMTALASLAMTTLAAEVQHGGGGRAPVATRPPREASQYDFLVGQWNVTVKPKVSGLAARIHGVPKLRGTWKAWRALDGWGVEDELRIVDESGNPQSFTRFLRLYDASARRWTVASVDVYRQRLTTSTAQWQGAEMTTFGEGTDADGEAYRTRTRVHRITPTSFRWQQDRSYDGGKTWREAQLVMEAARVSATATR